MEALERISEDYEMRINLKKTKVMMFTKGQPKKVPIWHRNTELKHVHEFCYLGSLLTEDAWCDKEIKKWIAMAKVAFMRRGQLLRENIWKDLKKWMVKALGRSVALCGSETWTLRKKDQTYTSFWDVDLVQDGEDQLDNTCVEVLSLVQEQHSRHQATTSQPDSTCSKTWLSSEDCARGEDRRRTDTRKTEKEDVGSIHAARWQQDQLWGAKERGGKPGRLESTEPASGQSMHEEDHGWFTIASDELISQWFGSNLCRIM